ncbi:hypothetical protein [Streptomyces sp. NPDC051452]|uniref:hypothetical protein n=1 Tax=Streptomyces sp. NPDC051452 TaxID=3365654 RepID=UPI0037B8F0C6
MNDATGYSMVPQAMIFRPKGAADDWEPSVTPTLFRQWVQLERYAGKRDYVTMTTKDLAEVWKNHPRRALEALNALSMSGWVAKDENGLQKGTYRLWMPWFRLSDWDEIAEHEAAGEFHAGEDIPGSEKFLQYMDNVTSRRAKGETLTDKRARALRDQQMARTGTDATPYVHLPVEVLSVAGNKAGDTDVLVWTAMRYFFGLGHGDIYAANGTVGSLVGVRRETVVRSTGRLVKAGFLEDTGRKTAAGTKVYTVPEHLSGKHGAGKNTSPVPVGAGV